MTEGGIAIAQNATRLQRLHLLLLIGAFGCAALVFFLLSDVTLYTVRTSGELSESYSTVAELTQDATHIALVTVTSSRVTRTGHVVFTLQQTNVQQQYKGTLDPTITILETGGRYAKVEHVFDKEPVMRKGDRAVVFLKPYTGSAAPAPAYRILGVYQGKFVVDPAGPLHPPRGSMGELSRIASIDDLHLTPQ